MYFDIIFYVRMRDGLAKMIINLEAQKDEPNEYEILNRAIFYVSRLVSARKNGILRVRVTMILNESTPFGYV